jgi:hypothetical protein
LHKVTLALIQRGQDLKDLLRLPIRERIAKCKYIAEDKLEEFAVFAKEIKPLNPT